MIKEALQYIIGLASGERFEIQGRDYSTVNLHEITPPEAHTLELHSLTGLVDYVKSGGDLIVDKGDLFIHVLSPSQVFLHGIMDEVWKQRDTFLKISLIDNSFKFGNWYEIEDFIVELQSKFILDDMVKDILQKITRIDQEASRTIEDNGLSQSTVIKKGVTTYAKVELPNPVELKPYRTFSEVEQPKSIFVFRIKSFHHEESLPRLALFDAGGNLWQYQAIQAIKNWLKEQLPDIAIIA